MCYMVCTCGMFVFIQCVCGGGYVVCVCVLGNACMKCVVHICDHYEVLVPIMC